MSERKRPRLSVTVAPEVLDAVDRIRESMPGMTRSGLVDAILAYALPRYEEVFDMFEALWEESGLSPGGDGERFRQVQRSIWGAHDPEEGRSP